VGLVVLTRCQGVRAPEGIGLHSQETGEGLEVAFDAMVDFPEPELLLAEHRVSPLATSRTTSSTAFPWAAMGSQPVKA
jgi:hypothetical protein